MDGNSMQQRLLSSKEEGGDLKGRICEESKKIWKIALPSVVSRVSSFGTIVVTQSFLGHISSTDLAGYALVQTLSVRFVNGILVTQTTLVLICLKWFKIYVIYGFRAWLYQ